MTELATVRYEVRDSVAVVTLNRPAVVNAFDRQMRLDLRAAAERANADERVRAVVLTGEGRGFSAGADLAEGLPPLVQRVLDEEYKPALLAIARSPKPWLAAVNGAAAGIGASFAMACDLMLMADTAYLYEAFLPIALVPDGGATWHIVRAVGPKRAFEMIVDAPKMPAARCVELGLANRVVPAAELMSEALAWAGRLAARAPLAVRYSKEAIAEACERDLGEMISYEAKLQNITLTSEDAKEGVTAFFEKRAPVFRGR